MITQLESVFGMVFMEQKNVGAKIHLEKKNSHSPQQNLAAVLEELDDDLYERYTEPRMRVFKTLLREAALQGGIDWYHAPCPTCRPRFLSIRINSTQLSPQPFALKYTRFSII